MRRIALAIALLVTLLIPGSAMARSERCSIEISPSVGSPTDVYRIAVSNVPVDPEGFSVDVRTDIRRLGSRDGAIIFAFLVPGITAFFVDYHYAYPGEPPVDPLVPGRYQVSVTTPHISGAEACHAVGQFAVG